MDGLATTQILIVDDDAGSRDALRSVLQDEGFSVAVVNSGAAALAYLRSSPTNLPGLIVLDLIMPGTDGWDFRYEQKGDPKLAEIPVIAVSAVGKLMDVDASFRKPLQVYEFLEAVHRHVRPARPRRGR